MLCYSRMMWIVMLVGLGSCQESVKQNNFPFSEPIVAEILEKIHQDYVEKPDEKKILQGALNGILMALDPYSAYLTPDSYKIYIDADKGEFGGLGMEVFFMNGALRVIAPMDHMPAYKAGIQAGDMITHVDDVPIASLMPEEVLKKLHGKPGTEVIVKINREMDFLTFKIKRERIVFNPIRHHMEGDIGYIRISHFNKQTKDQLYTTLRDMHQKFGHKLQGVILDLRNNPGGSLEQAVSVAELFLNEGIITQIKSRDVKKNQTIKALGKDMISGIPMAILVNRGSASASEIVAAALRDNRRALLVGEKTFGKGSVQGLYKLKNEGGIKITIAHFYTPKGVAIQEKGIQPDIVLPFSSTPQASQQQIYGKLANDQQLQRAVDLLKGLQAVKINF